MLLVERTLAALTFAGLAFGGPVPPHRDHGIMSMNGLLGERQEDEFDAQDLSFIKKLAALGDSYSAGIGAGDRLGSISQAFHSTSDWACSRYSKAYPRLVNEDWRLGDPAGREFSFLSCSGAVIQDVIDIQIPRTPSGQQAILLSAGGNDAELVNILNHCVYQWASLTPSQGVIAKLAKLVDQPLFKYLDVNTLTRTCDQQLDYSEALIASPEFSRRIDSVIEAAKTKLALTGTIYYTGYAKFWSKDMESGCDSVTWSTYLTKTHSMHHEEQYLTQAHRRRMNDLVDAVNMKLKEAVDRANSEVVFVDYSQYVEDFQGGFCGPYDDENPDADRERPQLMFFNLHLNDPFGSSPWKRSTDSELNKTFAGHQDWLTYLTSEIDPTAIARGENNNPAGRLQVSPLDSSASLAALVDLSDLAVPKMLPDGYGRVFHPRPNLYSLISNLVVFNMANQNRKANGIKVVAEAGTSGSCPIKPPDDTPTTPSSGQQIAIASYINPLGDPAAWTRLLEYNTGKVSVLVANVLNGPDYIVDPAWKSVIDKAASSGKKILGYVRTGYLGVSQQKFTTRLGSNNLADWTSQIIQDVDKWYELYGSSIGGIFFDEGWPECGVPDDYGNRNKYMFHYRHINSYTKRNHPGAFTVLNPGSPIASCYEDTMDALMTFENSYEAYKNQYVPNDWTPKDPRKIWHIIYRVPQDKIEEVAALAKSRHAGLLEITDDDNPNPYDNLPNDAYMRTLMAAVPGGKPLVAEPDPVNGKFVPGHVEDLRVVSSDYSSVTLNWRAVNLNNGHGVWLNGKLVLELPPMMDRATIGMLDAGSSDLQFEIRARLLGVEGSTPTFITASTKSLPKSGTIGYLTRRRDGNALVITADVLVPYAFVRLFIRSGAEDPITTKKNGWPLVIPKELQSDFISRVAVFDYLVEGNDFYSALYSYTGSWNRASTANAEWSWMPTDVVVRQTQSGYTYTWTLRPWSENKGGEFDAFAVQGQGYAPLTNVNF